MENIAEEAWAGAKMVGERVEDDVERFMHDDVEWAWEDTLHESEDLANRAVRESEMYARNMAHVGKLVADDTGHALEMVLRDGRTIARRVLHTGVRVGRELWSKLESEGRIVYKDGSAFLRRIFSRKGKKGDEHVAAYQPIRRERT